MKKSKIIILITLITLTFSACTKKESSKTTTPETKTTVEKNESVSTTWMDVTSIKSVYVDTGIFEHIGFAVPAANLPKENILAGVKYHGTSITLENESKPDTIMWPFSKGIKEEELEDFTSSKGVKIKVPVQSKLNFAPLDNTMKICRDNGLKMRGHVLVWHSQTPKTFFCEDYNAGKGFVSAKEMDARQEWYIKSVFEHTKDWEAKNNNGNIIIYAWDIVNEAISDNASASAYLRDGSNWYAIYKNADFIVSAFQYANKYAPKEVLLAYNDYNEFQGEKHNGYLKIIDLILAEKNNPELPSRIDIAGMQSHNQTGWPSMTEYETCIKNFIAKGLDIHITELDITGSWKGGNNFNKADPEAQKRTYNQYFKLYQKYRKTENTNGITGITFWGITDENSWRGNASPLLFNHFEPKPAYYGVIEAAN